MVNCSLHFFIKKNILKRIFQLAFLCAFFSNSLQVYSENIAYTECLLDRDIIG